MKALIEASTGKVLQAGYVDFEADENYDSNIHTIRDDAPNDIQVYNYFCKTYHRWDGSAYVLENSSNYLREMVHNEANRGQHIVYNWIADNVLTLSNEEKLHFFSVFGPIISALSIGGFTPALALLELVESDDIITTVMIQDIIDKIS